MRRTAAVMAVLATAASMSFAGPASAKVLEKGTFHYEDTHRDRNFCDVSGFTIRHQLTVDGRFLVKTRGPDQLAFFQEHVKVSEVMTNVATDGFVTIASTVMSKDHRVTDNGDGTLTILVLATGNSVVYDATGKAIARDPGQVRFEILIDHGGTPADPSDDEFLEFLGVVKGSTGRSDDFCAAIVEAIG